MKEKQNETITERLRSCRKNSCRLILLIHFHFLTKHHLAQANEAIYLFTETEAELHYPSIFI